MAAEEGTRANVQQTVPFFGVDDMTSSLKFYIDGLGFEMKHRWVVEGKVRWCWLELGGSAVMLQEFLKEGHDSWKPEGKVGEGVTVHFICLDALAIFHDLQAKGIATKTPFVGNGMWVVALNDPDGYSLVFESQTDETEGTEYRG